MGAAWVLAQPRLTGATPPDGGNDATGLHQVSAAGAGQCKPTKIAAPAATAGGIAPAPPDMGAWRLLGFLVGLPLPWVLDYRTSCFRLDAPAPRAGTCLPPGMRHRRPMPLA